MSGTSQWSAVRAHQQGLVNPRPPPPEQQQPPRAPPKPAARPPAPLRLQEQSPQPSPPVSAVFPLPASAISFSSPYPSSPSLFATEAKGGWAASVPLPTEDYFPDPPIDAPPPLLANYRQCRWSVPFGDGHQEWMVWWQRWWVCPTQLGERGTEVIELDLDEAEIRRRAEANTEKVEQVRRALQQASKDGKAFGAPVGWIWTMRKERAGASQKEDEDVLWIFNIAKSGDKGYESSDSDATDKDSLWEGDSEDEDPEPPTDRFPGLESFGISFCRRIGSGSFTYAHLFPTDSTDSHLSILTRTAGNISGNDVFCPNVGLPGPMGQPERDEVKAPYGSFLNALCEHLQRRLATIADLGALRWRQWQLLLPPRAPSLEPLYAALQASDNSPAAQQRILNHVASAPPSHILSLTCWLAPSGAHFEPSFIPLSVAPLPRNFLPDLPHGVPLLLGPWAVPARFARQWAAEPTVGNIQDPHSVNAGKRRAAVEAKLTKALKNAWAVETGEEWAEGEGEKWLVCDVRDGSGSKEIVWPTERCLLDFDSWQSLRTAAPQPPTVSRAQLLEDLAACSPMPPQIAELVISATDFTASVLKDRQRERANARSQREAPTPTTSNAGTPIVGGPIETSSVTAGLTPQSNAKPSPASTTQDEAHPRRAAHLQQTVRRGASPMALWGDDFGVIDHEQRANAGNDEWSQSRFGGMDDFDMDNFDMDDQFSFFDNPAADAHRVTASAPINGTSFAAPTVPQSLAGQSSSSPGMGVSPQYGAGSGYTASPSSLNTALFENQTPGSFTSQTPGRPGFTPDTGAVPTPAAAAGGGQATPPDAMNHDTAVAVHRSPTVPSEAFGSLSIATSAAKPSRHQPAGYEEVAFQSAFACADDHYASHGGKYSLPSPDPTLTDADEEMICVPVKRSFFNRLADPRTQRVRNANRLKKARIFGVGANDRAEWKFDDESDQSDIDSFGSDSDFDAADEDDELDSQDAEAVSNAAQAQEALHVFLRLLVRNGNSLSTPSPASDAQTSFVAPPAAASLPSMGEAPPLQVAEPSHVVTRHKNTVVSLPLGALPLWKKVGLGPMCGPRSANIVLVRAKCNDERPEDVARLSRQAKEWLKQLARVYEDHRLGSCEYSEGSTMPAPATVDKVHSLLRSFPSEPARELVCIIGPANLSSKDFDTLSSEDGVVHTVFALPNITLLDRSASTLRDYAFRIYDSLRLPLKRFQPPLLTLSPSDNGDAHTSPVTQGFAFHLEDTARPTIRIPLQWPVKSLDIPERYRIYHLAYRVAEDTLFIALTDELGRLEETAIAPLQPSSIVAQAVFEAGSSMLDALSVEIRLVITCVGSMNEKEHADWKTQLLKENASTLLARHITLLEACIDSAPPLTPLRTAEAEPVAPAETQDLEMGEVDTSIKSTTPRLSRTSNLIAFLHEECLRPLYAGATSHPLSVSYMYHPAGPSSPSTPSSLRLAILDTFASRHCSYPDPLQQLRDDVVRSSIALAQLKRLRGGADDVLPWHIASVASAASQNP